MAAQIEEALVARLEAQTAVAALTTAIRPYMLDQKRDKPLEDATPAIVIVINEETFEDQNIEGKCDLVTASVTISAWSGKLRIARTLAEAIRSNATNPGTGLQGCTVRSGASNFDAMLENRKIGRLMNEDGSDTGLYSVDLLFTVKYYETY